MWLGVRKSYTNHTLLLYFYSYTAKITVYFIFLISEANHSTSLAV